MIECEKFSGDLYDGVWAGFGNVMMAFCELFAFWSQALILCSSEILNILDGYELWKVATNGAGKEKHRGFFIMIEVANEKLKRFT